MEVCGHTTDLFLVLGNVGQPFLPCACQVVVAIHHVLQSISLKQSRLHAPPGMYADLDFEALRNLEELLEGHTLVLAAMGSDLNLVESMPNAWMASVPNHQFWLFCLQQIITRVAEGPRWVCEGFQ